jgi:hypothetical protein
MNAKQLLDKIKLALMDEPAPSGEVEVKMEEAKLKDGTVITYDVLAVGGVVMIGDVPAPVGEHTLEDGTVITLADNGVIVEIEAPEVTETPEVVEPGTDVIEARFAAIEKQTNEKFAAYESKFAQYEAKLNKANTVIEGLLGLTQLLVEQPTAKADGATSNSAAFAAQTAEEKLNNYSKILFTKKK